MNRNCFQVNNKTQLEAFIDVNVNIGEFDFSDYDVLQIACKHTEEVE